MSTIDPRGAAYASFHSALESVNKMSEADARDQTVGADGQLTDRKKGFFEKLFGSWFAPKTEGAKLRLAQDLARHHTRALSSSAFSNVSSVASKATQFREIFDSYAEGVREQSKAPIEQLKEQTGLEALDSKGGVNQTLSLKSVLANKAKVKAWIEGNKATPHGKEAIKALANAVNWQISMKLLDYQGIREARSEASPLERRSNEEEATALFATPRERPRVTEEKQQIRELIKEFSGVLPGIDNYASSEENRRLLGIRP